MATDHKSNSNKKRKNYLPQYKPVKKGSYPLRPGVEGFFITCDGGREHQAANEAISVIESFYEELVDDAEPKVEHTEPPKKPSNKIIKFADSDSSSSDADADDSNDYEDGDGDDCEDGDGEADDDAVGDGDGDGDGDEDEDEDDDDKDDTNDKNNLNTGENKDRNVVEDEDEDDDDKDDTNDKNNLNTGENKDRNVVASNDNGNDDSGVETDNAVPTENPTPTEIEKPENQDIKETEALGPPAKRQCTSADAENIGSLPKKAETTSVDKLIEAELAELGDKSKRRLCKLDTGCNGVVFIQMRKREGDPSPKDIVHHMMTSLAVSKKHVSRFLLRLLPVEVSCYTSDEEIKRAIKPVIEKYFPLETEKPHKFSVLYDARANTGINRSKVIDAIARSVPSVHKVDLTNPDISIMVQIVKTVCLIGVVEKYKELAKYNLRQLSNPSDEE